MVDRTCPMSDCTCLTIILFYYNKMLNKENLNDMVKLLVLLRTLITATFNLLGCIVIIIDVIIKC